MPASRRLRARHGAIAGGIHRSRRHFPPYNLGIRYSKFSDRADRAGYLHWCKTWAAEIARLLKADGSFFLNVGASPTNPMFPHQIVLELRDLFILQNTIHWIKSISIEEKNGKIVSRGHFKPISSQRFLNDCHGTSFTSARAGALKLIGSRSVFLIKTRATLRVGHTRAGAIAVVAATHGSSRMRRFKAAKKSGRIPRPFQSS